MVINHYLTESQDIEYQSVILNPNFEAINNDHVWTRLKVGCLLTNQWVGLNVDGGSKFKLMNKSV